MVEVVQNPDLQGSNSSGGRWMVVIFNNPVNTFEEVIEILIIATGCDAEEAFLEVWEADHYGKAAVHFSTQTDCQQVAGIVSSIGVKTEVSREWAD